MKTFGDSTTLGKFYQPTVAEQVEHRVDFLIRELDEFCAMASNAETAGLIDAERMAFGQMQTRVQLILSFLIARQPSKFRIIKNG